MLKKISIALLFIGTFLATGCVKRPVIVCASGAPGTERMTINFVCPVMGASYETDVYKCQSDKHFRMDFVCQLCGRRHRYAVSYWPTDYWSTHYYFYSGWFYPQDYWVRYWPYSRQPNYRTQPAPTYRPPASQRPPIVSPDPPPQRRIQPPTSRPPREVPMPPRQIQPPPPMHRVDPSPPSQTAQPSPPSRNQQGGRGPVRKDD